MSRIELWSRSLSRAELDLRSREARLRLEDLERLLVCHAVDDIGAGGSALLASSGIYARFADAVMEGRSRVTA